MWSTRESIVVGVIALTASAYDGIIPTAERETPPDEGIDEQTQVRQFPSNDLWGPHDGSGITHSETLKGFGCRRVIVDAPLFDKDDIPPGVIVGGEGLPHPGRPITEANIAMAATGIAKFRKAPIFLGHQEIRWEDERLIIHDSTA